MDTREIRVDVRRGEGKNMEWRENHDFRTEEDTESADGLMMACISHAQAVEWHYRNEDEADKTVTAFRVTAAFFVNLPGGGHAGAKVEVFREIA